MGRRKPPVVIGVTGGPGTGKSTVARMLGKLGAVVVDADRLAHEVMRPRRLAWRQVARAFGETILNADGTINHQALATRVFADAEARERLEGIVHPRVIREITRRLERLRRAHRVRAVVLDVPLLVEAGAQAWVDVLVVVTAPAEVQRGRLRARGWSEEDIAQRCAAQMELSAKAALADVVVDNGDGIAQTHTQVKELWKRLGEIRHTPRA